MKRLRIILIFMSVFAFLGSQTTLYGQVADIDSVSDLTGAFFDKTPASHYFISYDFTQKDNDYTESQLRRFEIVFLISLPVSLLLSYLGIQAYRLCDGRTAKFSSMKYRYLFFSSIGISFAVALNDNRITYKKGEF